MNAFWISNEDDVVKEHLFQVLQQLSYVGDLHRFQVFFNMPSIDLTLHQIHLLFRTACLNGHLQMAQWIFEKRPNIDIHCNEQFTSLYDASRNNHLNVVQWLLEQYHDNIVCNSLFVHFVRRGSFVVANMIANQFPKHVQRSVPLHLFFTREKETFIKKALQNQDLCEIIYRENQIVQIKIECIKERRWKRRKWALWLSLFQKDCILFHLPKDMIQYIIRTFL